MNGNIANGGLVVKFHDEIVFAKSNEWFLNTDGNYLYYSDRSDSNRVYRKRSIGDSGQLIMNEPCSFVTLYDDKIYYINEKQNKVYHCTREGKGKFCCSHTLTAEFCVIGPGRVYVNPAARRLCASDSAVYYADTKNEFDLTAAKPNGEVLQVFSGVKPSYINVHKGSIYYTDRMRKNSICRIDSSGNQLSIFGESVECLHVIDDWLYFISRKKWKRLSLVNFGEAEDL